MSPKVEKIKPFIKELSLEELEELKEFLINNYFKEFEKKELKEIKKELKKANHNEELIKDIIDGLKKASIYEN